MISNSPTNKEITNIISFSNKKQINETNIKFDFDNNNLENMNLSFELPFSSNKKFLKNGSNEVIYNRLIDLEYDKEEENDEIKSILSDLNKNIDINIKESENSNYNNACKEIIDILRKPLSDKYLRSHISPFKPLLKPRKISMEGKVFYDIKDDSNDNINSITTENSSNVIDVNNQILIGKK